MNNHIETLHIKVRDGEKVETFEIVVPDAVGFLLLKTAVGHYREDPKDAYDIYYCIRNYPDGIGSLAEACRPLLDHASAAKGFRFIAEKFDGRD